MEGFEAQTTEASCGGLASLRRYDRFTLYETRNHLYLQADERTKVIIIHAVHFIWLKHVRFMILLYFTTLITGAVLQLNLSLPCRGPFGF